MRFIERVYGKDDNTVYLTRIRLTPRTRWGQLYFHWFHRPDTDRAFHDHPWDFWTFPLQDYYEDVFDPETNEIKIARRVPAFRISFRPAEYAHTVLGGWKKDQGAVGPYMTFVWHAPKRRNWGFWVGDIRSDRPRERYWMHWKDYLL